MMQSGARRYKRCPNPDCNILCFKDQNLQKRVQCPACINNGKNLWFCWVCLRPWTNENSHNESYCQESGFVQLGSLSSKVLEGLCYINDDINKWVRQYHDKHAIQPSGRNLFEAKSVLERIKDHFDRELRMWNVFRLKRYESKGSSYEGLKIKKEPNDDDLEFDVDYVLTGGEYLEAIQDFRDPYYFQLVIKNPERLPELQKMMKGNEIRADIFYQKFFGQLQQCEYGDDQFYTKLSPHGPAVNIDVIYRNNHLKYFSIDLVPKFYVDNVSSFVAKPPKGLQWYPLWLKSFSYQEKEKLKNADQGNQCRKKVLRTLKVLIRRSELKSLSSHDLKMALFYTMDRYSDWPENKIGERLLNVLETLLKFVDAGNMNHYFMRGFNVLKFSEQARVNVRDRISRILSSQAVQRELFKV